MSWVLRPLLEQKGDHKLGDNRKDAKDCKIANRPTAMPGNTHTHTQFSLKNGFTLVRIPCSCKTFFGHSSFKEQFPIVRPLGLPLGVVWIVFMVLSIGSCALV